MNVLPWVWKSALIVLFGVFLLRLAGRKSIAQMTLATTIIMISIGTLLIQPLAGTNIWTTFFVASMLILTLIILEYAQMKWGLLETIMTGKAIPLISNGMVNEDELKRTRITYDQLETRLRQANITKIADVKHATLESSGQLGYELMEHAKTATKGDIDRLMAEIQALKSQGVFNPPIQPIQPNQPAPSANEGDNLFTEVEQGGHSNPVPDHQQ
ncbi:DUF421 domain-containing protein [Desmospora profundinema]|uniref:Uncharacterized membrane protein YcaP (DUF421 family) n=1 Tax=Desmospora profundinema TaxID=1571184 RepID=A0ABU1IMQ9_9BACL|nr:DUF421 domain-containing protein [Desmospora profundinema]MDR6226063.1 uncharacterized membrane protein YcaP (DUF421 family) [Desmospora profundinema]